MLHRYGCKSFKELESIFKAIDKNGDGMLTRAEIESAVKNEKISAEVALEILEGLPKEDKIYFT